MNFDDMNTAIHQAKSTLNLADSFAGKMADMLVGRLRRVSFWTLKALKKELQSFNARTGEWKD